MSGDIPHPPSPPIPPPPPCLTPPKLTRQTTYVPQISDRDDVKQTFYNRLKKNVLRRDGNKVLVSVNQEVAPVLQDGPCCGLVAVVMAAKMYGVELTLDDLFTAARDKGFTKQGEMFSAQNMRTLVEDFISCITVTSLDMTIDDGTLVQYLVKGGTCLIPYDSDFNHEPCNKRGHKAHWALLTGIGLVIDRCVCDSLTGGDGYVFTGSYETIMNHNLVNYAEEILVYGLHGKSQYPGVWSLSSLISSNRNLIEVDPNRLQDEIGYVLPSEGIESTLCGKALVLFGECYPLKA